MVFAAAASFVPAPWQGVIVCVMFVWLVAGGIIIHRIARDFPDDSAAKLIRGPREALFYITYCAMGWPLLLHYRRRQRNVV